MSEYRPYKGTRVSVSKSQEEIKKILRALGASAVQVTEVFEENLVRLRWKQTFESPEGEREAIIRLDVPMHQEVAGVKTTPPQIWRALYWWIKSYKEAVQFGFTTLADSFVGFMEYMLPDGAVVQVKDVVKEQIGRQAAISLEAGRAIALPGQKQEE